jgi:mRNA interferase MazF
MVRVMPDRENNLSKESAADSFQIRSVAEERLIKKLGNVKLDIMEEIRESVLLILKP